MNNEEDALIESTEQEGNPKLRYAVVGLGPIAQAGVLPAFANASENSELVAFVSDDPLKHKKLGKRYRVSLAYSLDDYDACLRSGEVDAVYLTLSPRFRKDFALRAIEAGLHVICERPVALSEDDCAAVLRAAQRKKVKVLAAYRLYQQEGNTKALEFCQAGKIGELRAFCATLTTTARPEDPRLETSAGGPILQLGLDAIHLARKLFGADPVEAFASAQRSSDPRFVQTPEGAAALLRFPDERLAMFTLSLNTADASYCHIFGTKGDLRCEPAFDLEGEARHIVTVQGKRRERGFVTRESFSPMLLRFSDSVLRGGEAQPGLADAVADVRAARALERSIQEGKPVRVRVEPPPVLQGLRPLPPRRAEYAYPLSAVRDGRALPAAAAPAPARRELPSGEALGRASSDSPERPGGT